MRVVAAMSGGVDSAVAAARMLDAGHDVVGVHLALSRNASRLRESARGCCTLEDAGDARRVADRLGIEFEVGDTTKARIREEAAARGFSVARKPDSHDICFIPDGDTRGFLGRTLGAAPGDLVDATTGTVVGRHAGTHGFTVGQRRGLGLDRSSLDGEPRYVVEVDADRRQVVIGTADLLTVREIVGDHVRWCGPVPEGTVRVGAQIRAHGEEVAATAYLVQGQPEAAGGARLNVRLDTGVRGVAPGQSVVLYDGTRVVGSATICATERAGASVPEAGLAE